MKVNKNKVGRYLQLHLYMIIILTGIKVATSSNKVGVNKKTICA